MEFGRDFLVVDLGIDRHSKNRVFGFAFPRYIAASLVMDEAETIELERLLDPEPVEPDKPTKPEQAAYAEEEQLLRETYGQDGSGWCETLSMSVTLELPRVFYENTVAFASGFLAMAW